MLRFRAFILACFLGGAFGILPDLFSEPSVTITTPVLKPGMDSLEDLLAASVGEYADDILELVSTSLDKPRFMQGFGGAAAQVVLIPSALHYRTFPTLSLGSAASVYAENLSPDTIDRLSDMNEETDLKSGLCIQPLVIRAAFPLDFLLRGLSGGVSAGYMDASTGQYGVWACTAGVFAGYTFFRPRGHLFSWDGLYLGTGADFAINRLRALIRPGVISKDVEIDPDGRGPLVAESATLRADPDIDAGVISTLYSAEIRVTTGITIAEAFSLFAGAGCTAGVARAAISIDTDEEITVEGYLGDLIETPGSVRITGTTSGYETRILAPFGIFGVSFHVGPFELGVPVVWRPNDSLGIGAFLGAQF